MPTSDEIDSKTLNPHLTVVFDDKCSLCSLLAEYLKKKGSPSFEILKYTDFLISHQQNLAAEPRPLKPENLGLIKEGRVYWGAEAWENIILSHPTLSSLSWLAQKIGVIKVTATMINSGSHIIRRLCFRCPQ